MVPAGLPWDWQRVPAQADAASWKPRESLKAQERLREAVSPSKGREAHHLPHAAAQLDPIFSPYRDTGAPGGAVNGRANGRAVHFGDSPAAPPRVANTQAVAGHAVGSGLGLGPQRVADGHVHEAAGAAGSAASRDPAAAAGVLGAAHHGAAQQGASSHAQQGPTGQGRQGASGQGLQNGCHPSSPGDAELEGWLAEAAALTEGHDAGAARLPTTSPFAAAASCSDASSAGEGVPDRVGGSGSALGAYTGMTSYDTPHGNPAGLVDWCGPGGHNPVA